MIISKVVYVIRQFQGADNSAHFKVGPVQSGYENNSLISIFMYSQHFLGFTNNMLLTSVLPGAVFTKGLSQVLGLTFV